MKSLFLPRPSPFSEYAAIFGLGLDVSTIAAQPRAACALERSLKTRSRGRQATRTLSTAGV
jgi:hypothetical protein